MDKIINNATKRKFEEGRKEREEKDIAIKYLKIKELKEELEKKKNKLLKKKKEMETYKVNFIFQILNF